MDESARVTIYDVALRAHVSAQTVSRVVNRAGGVAPATRERVQRAIDELGFLPDPVARALRTGRSQRIGVLAHQMTATGPSGNTAAALAELRSAGYELDIVPLVDDPDPEVTARAAARAMTGFARSTCAVMALIQTETARSAVLQANLGLPVYIDEFLDRGTDAVPGAEELLARAAADHLLDAGHRVVAHLPGPPDSLAARHRHEAFTAAVQRRGQTCIAWPAGDWSADSGSRVAAAVEVGDVSAVFVANDAMAHGALSALAARGIRVPDHLAVMGADDLAESAYTTPPLTSVHHDLAAEGRLAALILLADLEERARPDPSGMLTVCVRKRASTGAPLQSAESRDR